MNFEPLIKDYLEHLKRLNRAPRSLVWYAAILKDFAGFTERLQIRDIVDIRESHILDYQKYRSEYINRYKRHDAFNIQNVYLSTIKNFLKYLKVEGYLAVNPAENIEYVKVPYMLPKPALTHKEFLRLVSKVDVQNYIGYRDRTIIEVLYSSALRRNELLNLKLKDADYEEGYLRILGKGNRERVVPLGKKACQYLENYIKGVRPLFCFSKKSDYLFVSNCHVKLSEQGIKEMIKKYAALAKLEKHVTPHTFRRSAATGMIRNNANVMLVRDMLGHESMEAINRYVNLAITDLKAAHKKTHPRERCQ